MTELPYQRAFHRIRSELFATPDARLTAAQVESLAGVDLVTCRTVLVDLVRAGFLSHFDGGYGRSRSLTEPHRR
jgi:Fic family protein